MSSLQQPLVYALYHNNNLLYCVKRENIYYFVQKYLWHIVSNHISSFNNICWTHKIEKHPLSITELRVIKATNPIEVMLKKASIISLPVLETLLKNIHKETAIDILYQLIQSIDNESCKPLQMNNTTVSSKVSDLVSANLEVNILLISLQC